jgi:hypothetical protein
MTFQSTHAFLPIAEDAGRRMAHLRHVLELVSQLAGRVLPAATDDSLDEAARVSAAYAHALPIAQRRYDAFAAETADWAAVGAEALLEAGHAPHAAARLAVDLDSAIGDLRAILRV